MGKFFGLTRTLCRPAHKVVATASSASLEAFTTEKHNYDDEQLQLIKRVLEDEKSGEVDLSKLKTALA